MLALVRDAGSYPFSGALSVFRANRLKRIKIVWLDRSGVCLYAKRLEKLRFFWPHTQASQKRPGFAREGAPRPRIGLQRQPDSSVPLVPVAIDEILEAGQLFRPNRSTGVHLASRNPDFCSHAEFAAVGKLGGGIVHHDR